MQLATRFDEAPLAYLLSALAAVVYVVATVALARGGQRGRRIALAAITVELVGVLVVGHAVAGRPGGLPRRDGVVGVRPRLLLRPAGAAGAGAAAAAAPAAAEPASGGSEVAAAEVAAPEVAAAEVAAAAVAAVVGAAREVPARVAAVVAAVGPAPSW